MSAESASDFINDEFSVVAEFGAVSTTVQFDKTQFFQGSVLTTRPLAVGDSAVLSVLVEGDLITVDGTSYKVAEKPTDDGLMTTVVLRNA